MNVNLQRFTRTWPKSTVEGEEGGDNEVEEEDELGGGECTVNMIIIITQKPFTSK